MNLARTLPLLVRVNAAAFAFTAIALSLTAWMVRPAQTAATFVIDDSDFALQNWAVTPVGAANPNQITVTQEMAGGNPGAFRKVASAASDQYFDFLNLRAGAVYDPSEQGPISSIDWELDVLSISNSVKGWAGIYQLVLVQDGVLFEGDGAQASEPGWFEWPTDTLQRQGDFYNNSGNGPVNPDFSQNGGPIQFGYLFSANKRGGVSGIDNLVVKVNSTGGAEGANLFAEWHDDLQLRTRRVRGGNKKCTIKSLIVSNDGGQDAPASKAAFFLSDDDQLDKGDVSYGTKAIKALGRGRSKTYAVTIAVKRGQVDPATASAKFLIAVLDSTRRINETDETDNLAVAEIP